MFGYCKRLGGRSLAGQTRTNSNYLDSAQLKMTKLTFGRPSWVILRAMPDSFVDALQEKPVSINLKRARKEHNAYVQTIESFGIGVIELPSNPTCPDSCFIEDTAIVVSPELALTTCPGAPTRRPEVEGVRQGLEGLFGRTPGMPIHRQATIPLKQATLDGGDVLRAGRTFFVGLSSRTSKTAVSWLKDLLAEEGHDVVGVEVHDGLHLKSAATMVDETLVIVDPNKCDTKPFVEAGLGIVEALEPEGANVLALPPNKVIMSSAAPRTADALRALGYEPTMLQLSEMHKADGALTCCSLRVPAEGEWCV